MAVALAHKPVFGGSGNLMRLRPFGPEYLNVIQRLLRRFRKMLPNAPAAIDCEYLSGNES